MERTKNIMEKLNEEKPLFEPAPSIHQCIICGTSIEDLEEDDYIKIQYGYLCKGCLDEKWFVKCDKCGEYEFEASANYIDEEDIFLCNPCYLKRVKDV